MSLEFITKQIREERGRNVVWKVLFGKLSPVLGRPFKDEIQARSGLLKSTRNL
jgi:hypothetical protein